MDFFFKSLCVRNLPYRWKKWEMGYIFAKIPYSQCRASQNFPLSDIPVVLVEFSRIIFRLVSRVHF